jgi:hypothetical protein
MLHSADVRASCARIAARVEGEEHVDLAARIEALLGVGPPA